MLSRRVFLGSASFAMLAGQANASEPQPQSDRRTGDAVEPLVDYLLETRFEDIPGSALEVTRHQLRDTLGVAVAARRESGVAELRELIAEFSGRGESALWGDTARAPAPEAARLNAVMAHALEFDDTFEPGFLHPSAITFPAALAVADHTGDVSGREFLTATTLAMDIACRLSIAGQPGVDGFSVGWHYTTLIGYLSSALVAARLMRLNRDQAINAIGIASHQAAGNAQSHLDGALSKRFGPGFACASGVFAARLAARGVTGPRNVLEGDRGFFRQYHGNRYSRDLLLGGLGVTFPAEQTSFKPWPSCRGSHTSADAALQLVGDHGLRPEEIARIIVYNAPSEWPFLSQPLESKRQPATTVEAQFSIPWVVAAVFTDQRLSLAHFTKKALDRSDIITMAGRIETIEDIKLSNPDGGPGQARIEVLTHDGRRLCKQVGLAKGSPAAPMSPAETFSKFADCMAFAGAGQEYGLRLWDATGNIDSLTDVKALSDILAGA